MRRRMLLPSSEMYLTIISAADNNTIGWKCSAASIAKTIQVSTDNGVSWTAVTSITSGATLATLNNGEKMMVKGNNDRYAFVDESSSSYNSFTSTGLFDLMGDIMSLIYNDSFVGKNSIGSNGVFAGLFNNTDVRDAENLVLPSKAASYCYYSMFNGCTSLINVPALPAKSLFLRCYQNMFYGCTSLVTAPALPATNLANRCYYYMFYGCTSLINVPATLPAKTLKYACYAYMFNGCTSLINVPALPATTLSTYCYQNMFYGCTSLVTAPALPATNLANRCYYYMFYGCTSLINAPVLPATNLTDHCYSYMFYGCTSLVTAPELPATTLVEVCYGHMFRGCTSLVNAPALPATTLSESCYYYMFSGCTSLINAPVLPATTLAGHCYSYMFHNCTSLISSPVLPATTLVEVCYGHMFTGCTSMKRLICLATNISANSCTNGWMNTMTAGGTFIKHPSMTSWPRSNSGIKNGWAILEAVQITVTYTSGNSGAYLKEISTNDVIHTFIDGEAEEFAFADAKTYGVYDSNDNLIETLATPFNRLNSITI